MYADIMRDDDIIIRGHADHEENDVPLLVTHALSTIVLECSEGQVVWVRCGGSGSQYMWGDSNRQSHFMGFLLQRLP